MDKEKEILRDWEKKESVEAICAVITKEELKKMQAQVKNIYIHDRIMDYIISLSDATRNHEQIQLGLSTRGSIAVTRRAKAAAYKSRPALLLQRAGKGAAIAQEGTKNGKGRK